MEPDRMLRLKEVLRLVRVDQSTLHLWRKTGKFPPPACYETRHPKWRECDVLAWMEANPRKGK